MQRRRTPLIAAALATLASACSGGDDAAGATSTTAPPPTSVATSLDLSSDPAPESGSGPSSAAASSEASDTVATTSADPPPTAPATGVPGLDSDDEFCAAWSRFGGTWQVLLVGSTFLEDPDQVAAWEIASAQVVNEAYADLMEFLPDGLESERTALEDGYFGVLDRRIATARSSLDEAGAVPADVELLAAAWLDALAARDPSTPDLPFAVPEELTDVVDRAVDDLQAQRVPFHQDPSLIVAVETPLTDDYLDRECPDQGALAGGEVG